jgi:hypothetical protein
MIQTTIAGTLLLELSSLLRQVSDGNHNVISILFHVQRNGVATAGLAHALRVNGRSTVLADEAGRALIKSNAAADLAGVKD